MRGLRQGLVAWCVALVCLAPGVVSCTWRTAAADHYIGPVLLKRRMPPDARGHLVQAMRAGVSFEGGRQWGMGLGLMQRFSASPGVERLRECDTALGGAIDEALDDPSGGDGPGWQLSPFYTRVDHVAQAYFIERRICGLEVAAGNEANALSLGYKRTTAMHPPADGLFAFRFSTAEPMDTVFVQLECEDEGQQGGAIPRKGRNSE